MAHAADHRQRRAGDGAHQGLVVEGPEVVETAAAAHQQQHIDFLPGLGLPKGGDQFGGCGGALHAGGVDHDSHLRAAAAQGGEHVAQRGSLQRGDDPDGAGHERQGPLAFRIEQAFALQLGLEPQKGFEQRAFAIGLHAFDNELEVATGFVDGHRGPQTHAQPVAQRQGGQARPLAKPDAAQLRRAVLEVEVLVAACGPHQPRHLAPHGKAVEAGIQRVGKRL